VDRIYEAVRVWLGCFSSLSEALHPGHVRVAVVDERGVNVAGEEAWIWLAVEPRSGRLLALRLSWTRKILVAYGFLKHLRDSYGVRVVVVDGADWYIEPRLELRIRRQVERGGVHSLMEPLNKEVKRRLKDFDLYFPRDKSLHGAKAWLQAWKAYYNQVRYHMTLKRSPCNPTPKPEPRKMLKLIKEMTLS